MSNLTQMKKSELIEYVQAVHDIDLSENAMTRDALLNEAMRLDAKAEVAVELAAPTEAEASDREAREVYERMAAEQPEGDSMVVELKKATQFIVRVFPSEGDDGSAPVKISVNGYAYLIPRDTDVTLPEPVVKILDNAVVTQFFYNDQGTLLSRNIRRYNYTSRPAE